MSIKFATAARSAAQSLEEHRRQQHEQWRDRWRAACAARNAAHVRLVATVRANLHVVSDLFNVGDIAWWMEQDWTRGRIRSEDVLHVLGLHLIPFVVPDGEPHPVEHPRTSARPSSTD
jgi:hypothetical protein